jgi:hypothetical protein
VAISAFAGTADCPPEPIVEGRTVQHPSAAVQSGNRFVLNPEQLEKAHQTGLLPPDAKSLLKVRAPLGFNEFVWDEKGIPAGPLIIWINLRTQVLSVYQGGHEIATSLIVYGAPEANSPQGNFRIISKVRDYHSRSYDAPMPYSMFLTDDGVAIHASSMAPTKATHGCIGIPKDFARMLFAKSDVGDVVSIVSSADLRS